VLNGGPFPVSPSVRIFRDLMNLCVSYSLHLLRYLLLWPGSLFGWLLHWPVSSSLCLNGGD
jgi:hypothetical protein